MKNRPFAFLEQKEAGGDWTPAEITTQVWIDPSDSSTVTLSGTTIVSVADNSGEGHDLLQSEDTSKRFTINTTGINGVQSMQASDDCMYLDYHTDVETNQVNWFFVVKPTDTNPSVTNSIIRRGYGNNSLGGTIRYTSSGIGGFWRGTGSSGAIDTDSSPSSPSIVEMKTTFTNNNSQLEVYQDANRFSNNSFAGILKNQNDDVRPIIGGAYTSDTWTTGNFGDEFTGDIGEIIFVAGDNVTIDTQEKIQGYLAWKWGLEGNLPSDHPYKNAAPTI